MTTLGFDSVSSGPLRGMHTTFAPGPSIVLSTHRSPLEEVAALSLGLTAPRSGSVHYGTESPYRSPKLRAALGSLLSEESLPDARSLRAALELLLEIRGALSAKEQCLACLDAFGLGERLDVAPRQLSCLELRLAALGLALSLPKPLGLVLLEPLAFPEPLVQTILERIIDCAQSRPVLLLTVDELSATRLGGPTGRLVSGVYQPITASAPRLPTTFLLEGRAVGSALPLLTEQPFVTRVVFTDGVPEGQSLRITTLDRERTTELVVRHFATEGALSNFREVPS